MLGPSSLAGGKGKKGGRGPSKGAHMNPLDSTGQRMTCHECGSDRHLVRSCPQRGKGKKGSSFYQGANAPAQAAIATAGMAAASSRGPLAGAVQSTFFALADREEPGDIPLLITMPR